MSESLWFMFLILQSINKHLECGLTSISIEVRESENYAIANPDLESNYRYILISHGHGTHSIILWAGISNGGPPHHCIIENQTATHHSSACNSSMETIHFHRP
ncbi:hypothetical protein Trydic_g15541 [Trypoxylus dichotomus]